MDTASVRYIAGDIEAIGYLASPPGIGPHPAVLVVHEGPGLDAHARHRADRLAELGYIALAADLHGDGYIAKSHEETLDLVSLLRSDRQKMRARILGAYDALCKLRGIDPSRTAAIGFCFGGMAVLELARAGAPVSAVVSFHGLLDTPLPAAPGVIRAQILVCTGAADFLVPITQVNAFEEEMTAAGADWRLIKYGGVKHAFTNHIEAEKLAGLGFGYDLRADKHSWKAALDFLCDAWGLG